ncbi:hypothetical protein SUDANB70_04764 [Streptomyces sp. enrichment culture]
MPWYSALPDPDGRDFNEDFEATREHHGHRVDRPGLSCFLRDGDRIFHTYSTYERGLDGLGSTTSLLDLTALGRQEPWEEPKGRASSYGAPAGRRSVITTSTTTDTKGDRILRKAETGLTRGGERVSTTSQYRH